MVFLVKFARKFATYFNNYFNVTSISAKQTKNGGHGEYSVPGDPLARGAVDVVVGGGLALSMYSISGFRVSLCGASSLCAQHTLLPRQHVGVVKSVVLYERNLPSVPVAHHQSILPDLVATRIAFVQTRVNGDAHAPPLVTCRQHVEGLKVGAHGLVTPVVFFSTRRVLLRSNAQLTLIE